MSLLLQALQRNPNPDPPAPRPAPGAGPGKPPEPGALSGEAVLELLQSDAAPEETPGPAATRTPEATAAPEVAATVAASSVPASSAPASAAAASTTAPPRPALRPLSRPLLNQRARIAQRSSVLNRRNVTIALLIAATLIAGNYLLRPTRLVLPPPLPARAPVESFPVLPALARRTPPPRPAHATAVAPARPTAAEERGPASRKAATDTGPATDEAPAAADRDLEPSSLAIRHVDASKALDRHLSSGYQALLARDYSRAYEEYRAALNLDPNRVDALLGLAALAAHDGKRADATDLYTEVLRLVPSDPDAVAGLAALSEAPASDQESQLKYALATDSGPIAAHVALGNVFARQGRWPEAAQEYFTAFSKDAGNPDLAYNLAASLDQAHSPGMAATYYRQALLLAQHRPPGFDAVQVAARLRQLDPAAPSP